MKQPEAPSKPARVVRIDVPMCLVSEANAREHHFVKARRVRNQKTNVGWHLMLLGPNAGDRGLSLPIRVVLTRLGTRLFDTDNNIGSFKHVRDAIAKWFGVDDADERYEWVYRQAKCKKGHERVVVEFQEVGGQLWS